MTYQRIISILLVLCLTVGLVSVPCLALDTSALHSYNQPEGYHLFTALPTAENTVTNATVYLGGAFEENGAMVFHGMNSSFTSGSATTTTDADAQYTITVHYGGVDETYGTYYYLVFTLPNNTAYAFAYASGYFTQNKIQSDGLPSGGWAAKHKLFYHEDEHFFYHRPSADMTVMKGLKISATSFKFFTDTVQNMLKDNTYPVRLYEKCTYDEVAGNDDTHHWSGSCTCGEKNDYAAHDTVTDWNVKEAAGHGKACSCGYVLEALTAHDLPADWTVDPESGIGYALCESCGYKVFQEHEHLFGSQVQYDNVNHWQECICGEKSEAAVHTFGQWEIVEKPLTLTDKGSDKRTCEACAYFETRETSLSVENFGVLTSAPEAGVPFYLGATQQDVENAPTYFFKGTWAPTKYQNMDVAQNMALAAPVYAEEAAGGYKLYFDDNGTKTYLIIANLTVSGSTGVFVQPVTNGEDASIFTWNESYHTFQTTVEGKGDYYIGNYTDNGTNYTKLQALLVSGLGREGRFPAKLYSGEYDANPHEHIYGQWVTVTAPTHLSDQGRDERACQICGRTEERFTTLSAEDFAAITKAPATDVPFYLGATQLQIENTPTYFFKGAWAPTKYQNMDVTTQMESAKPMYAEAVNGGYKLYFDNDGVKTYLMIAKMTVSESEGVYVQPVTDAKKASVFMWNQKYGTFQTHVAGKGDYYIGLYSTETIQYTKLQALLVSGLGRDDRHPAKVYMQTFEADGHEHSFSKWKNRSYATHLNDHGVQERVCECGYVEARVAVVGEQDYIPATNPPAAGVGFYLGATQTAVEGEPTYFFKGAWAPKKYQSMDVTTKMTDAALMYAQAVEGGFKLYFMDEGVKTYLMIANMTVAGDEGVYVQPVTSASKASVFTWNYEFCTFQTAVEGKGDYYIGNYSHNGTDYTKLSALLVSGLGRDDRHSAAVYVSKYISDDTPDTGDHTPVMVMIAVTVVSLAAVVSLAVGRKKHI